MRLLCLLVLVLLPFQLASKEQEMDVGVQCPDSSSSTSFTDFKQFESVVNGCQQAGRFERALTIALLAKSFASNTPVTTDDYSALLFEATSLHMMGLFSEALIRYEQIIEHADTAPPMTLQSAYNNAAVILQSTHQYDAASQMIEQALGIASVDKHEENYNNVIATYASILLSQKNYIKTAEYLRECLSLANQGGHQVALTYCQQTQAELAYETGKYNESFQYASAAIKYAVKENVVSDLAEIYLTKAKAEAKLDKTEAAIKTASEGVNIASKQNDDDSALSNWKFLEQLYQSSANWEAAFKARSEADKLNKRIFDSKLANSVAYHKVQRDMERKEKEILALRSDNIIHQAEASAAKAQRTATISISILLLAIIFIGYSRWIHKRDLLRADMTNTELKHLHELKDQFLANTSHELRTPLNGIIGLSDLLVETEKQNLSSLGIEQLCLIRDCGTQLSDMVDSILDFSQLRAGKGLLDLQATSLTEVVKFVQPILQPLANKKNLKLQVEIPEKLPFVLADQLRLRKILTNLIGNAIKFTEKGFVEIHAQTLTDQRIRISVRDSGIGIPESRLESVFEPFEQVDGSLRRRNGGVGLGLAIAQELVRAHGSELEVHSTVNVGSEFSFVLPQAV